MEKYSYDIIIPVASKDVAFVPRVVKYIRKNLKEADTIYVISNIRNRKSLNGSLSVFDKCEFIDENNLLPGLDYRRVQELLWAKDKSLSVGWFFQQFLKFGFGLTEFAQTYYLSWDADTLPLRDIPFFKDGHPLFTMKYEYNDNYFRTIERLIGIKKNTDFSYIAEHMLFNKEVMRNLIAEIEVSDIPGSNWIEKIINAGNYEAGKPTFSEFETYGTYVHEKYPKLYLSRTLNTFRYGGFIHGRKIEDWILDKISFDTDTISFELGHEPLFPYNIGQRIEKWSVLFFSSMKKYTFKEFFNRLIVYLRH